MKTVKAIDELALLQHMRECEQEIITELSGLVVMNSYTYAPEDVNRFGSWLSMQFQKMGCRTEILPSCNPSYGNHIKVTFGHAQDQVLIIAHMDTVFPKEDTKAGSLHVEKGRAYGPGVYDMKGGILQLLWAVRLMKEYKLEPKYQVCIIISSDAEAGGTTARKYVETEAIHSKAVYGLESAVGESGELKKEQHGTGRYKMTITGTGGHPGRYLPTTSAIQELTFQIQRLHSLSHPEDDVIVNVGQIWGGNTVNTISANATALIELRFLDAEEGKRTEEIILRSQPFTNCRVEVNGGIIRPSLRRNADTQRLMCMVKRLGVAIGLNFKDGAIGEASDGNYAAALGVPTLDGLGPVGGGAHSSDEFIEIRTIAERTVLLVSILCNGEV